MAGFLVRDLVDCSFYTVPCSGDQSSPSEPALSVSLSDKSSGSAMSSLAPRSVQLTRFYLDFELISALLGRFSLDVPCFAALQESVWMSTK